MVLPTNAPGGWGADEVRSDRRQNHEATVRNSRGSGAWNGPECGEKKKSDLIRQKLRTHRYFTTVTR